jgi:3-oxoacyl-[acyl-carrier protein] reductase
MIDTGLVGKVVLVSGANNPYGIGAAIAKAFASEGAKVFITYLRETWKNQDVDETQPITTPGLPFWRAMLTKSADHVVQALRDEGGHVEAWETDLSDPRNIPQLFDRAEAAFGQVDVLVNNAAFCEWPETIFTTSAETIDKHFAVNTRAAVLMIHEFVRRHQNRGGKWGRIISLSTDAARCFVGSISYGASKTAMEAFTRSTAIEVGPLNITVNTIAPGPTQTGSFSAESEEKLLSQIPLGRIGQPKDIANAIIFLASEQASWLTGQVIQVSGGHAL